MGKVIKKKLNGMSWWMKTSLVLILTLATSVFMYHGWYKPLFVQAATVTYQVSVPSTASVGIDGSGTLSATGTTIGSGGAPGARAEMVSSGYTTSASRYTPTTGMTSGTAVSMMKFYGPVYATAQTITAPSGDFAVRGYNTTDTWTFHVYDYNPSGTAGNKSLMYSSNVVTPGTTSVYAAAPTYTLVNSSIAAGHRLMVEIVYTPNGATLTPRIYLDGTATLAWCRLTVTESAGSGNLSITNGTNPVSANAAQASTNNAMNGFSMFMSAGSSTVSTLRITGGAQFTSANVSAIRVYDDLGVVGTYEAGTDTLIPSTTAWATNVATLTLTTPEPVTTATTNYLVVVDIAAGATVAQTLTGTITAATGTGIGTPTYNDSSSGTLTVTAGAGLTVGDSTNPANANASRGSTNNALDGFTMVTTTGAATINTVTLTGSANLTATNVTTPNGVKVYHDNGTLGVLDGADTLIPTTSSITGNVATITFTTPEAVNTTLQNYIVVVDVPVGATLAQTFTGTITAATGSGYVSSAFNDTASATLTVTAAQTLTVGNGTNPANANIKTSGSAALEHFTLALNTGNATINTLTLTGSANFILANVNHVDVYADNGVLGTYEAGTDTAIATTYSQTGTVGTITFTTPEPVTAVAKNYLAVVTLNAGATLTNTFTGTITAASGTGIGTPTYSDTASATLTIIAGPISTITNCGGCHFYTGIAGKLPADTTGRNTPTAGLFQGNHATHAGDTATAGQYGFVCTTCHKDNTAAGNSHQTGFINLSAAN